MNRVAVIGWLAACLLCACLPQPQAVQLSPIKNIHRIETRSYNCDVAVADMAQVDALLAEINALRQVKWHKIEGGKQGQGDTTFDMALYGVEALEQGTAEKEPRILLILNEWSGLFTLFEANEGHRQLKVSGYFTPKAQPIDKYPSLYGLWMQHATKNAGQRIGC